MSSPFELSWWTGDEDRDQVRLRVWQIIAELPERQELVLRTWCNLAKDLPEGRRPTVEQLAKELGRSKSTIHEALVPALEHVSRRCLEDESIVSWLRRPPKRGQSNPSTS